MTPQGIFARYAWPLKAFSHGAHDPQGIFARCAWPPKWSKSKKTRKSAIFLPDMFPFPPTCKNFLPFPQISSKCPPDMQKFPPCPLMPSRHAKSSCHFLAFPSHFLPTCRNFLHFLPTCINFLPFPLCLRSIFSCLRLTFSCLSSILSCLRSPLSCLRSIWSCLRWIFYDMFAFPPTCKNMLPFP